MSKRKRPPTTASHPVPPRHRSGEPAWLYGLHAVRAALANPERRTRRLVVAAGAEEAVRLASSFPKAPAPEVMERPKLDRLLDAGAVHQGIALLADPLEPTSLDDLRRAASLGEKAVLLMLDRVSDPRNVGAVLRSAAAFGVAGVIVQDRHAPEATAAMAKAASGALETVPLARVPNLVQAMILLKDDGFWCTGLAADGPEILSEANLGGRVVLVVGSEGDGLRRLVRETCDFLVRIPISGPVESLNLSNAVAVALYDIARRSGS